MAALLAVLAPRTVATRVPLSETDVSPRTRPPLIEEEGIAVDEEASPLAEVALPRLRDRPLPRLVGPLNTVHVAEAL